MADFISLAALKTALEVTDSSKDALLSQTNGVATQMLIDFMERDPRADDFVERTHGLGTTHLLVNQYPINEVSAVTITRRPGLPDGDLVLDRGQFDWDAHVIWRADGQAFPRGSRNVTVVYNAGLDPAPRTLGQAAVYTVRALLTARKVDLNASGESWAGVSSQSWSAYGPGTVPVAAQTLLRRFVRRMSV